MSKLNYSLLALSICMAQTAMANATEAVGNDSENLGVTVVSASRMDQNLEDVIGSISVITAEDIEKQVITDMNQLFRYEPGVFVSGSVGGAQNINVRGMSGNRVLIIKDGMRMNEGYGANGLNDIIGRGFIDTETLKQVEVAKGASSSLYGADALAGTVVFTTKDASDYLKNGENIGGKIKATYEDGSEQTSLSGTLALRTGPVDHLLSVTGRDGSEQQNYRKTREPFDIESKSLLYKAKWHLNETDSLGLSIDSWEQDVEGARAGGLLVYFRGLSQFGYNIAQESQTSEKRTRSFKLNYHSEADRAAYDYLDVSLYKNTNKQSDVEYGLLDINAPMFGTFEKRDMWENSLFKQETVGFLSSASKELNSVHTLGYGLDIEKTETRRTENERRIVRDNPASPNNRETKTNKFPKNDIDRYGFYINDTISLMDDRLKIIPGARFDRYKMDPNGASKVDGTAFKSADENNLSFNLGAMYDISSNLAIYAQYGQGFKVPAYDLAYIEHDLTTSSSYRYTLVPNEDLDPEKSDTFELGLRGQTGKLAFNAALFYNIYDDFLTTELINSTFDGVQVHDTFHYRNIDKVIIKGAELALRYSLTDNLALYGNASYQHGKDDKTDRWLTTISPLSGIVGIGYQDANWHSDLVANWSTRMSKVNSGDKKTPGYVTLDWQAGYNFSDTVKANLAVYNLLDKKYLHHNTASGHGSSADLSSLYQPGRVFNASLSYHF